MSTFTKDELKMLRSYMDVSINYLEFGAGESTEYASGIASIKNIDSVESSSDFVQNHLMARPVISDAISSGKLSFHTIDLGKTGQWGYPKTDKNRHLWSNYSQQVFSKQSLHDLAFIDGRFRVACILSCLLHVPRDCKIIVHDFWSRPKYHVVLRFLRTIDDVDSLGVFCRRDDLDMTMLRNMIMKYQYLPGF